MKKKICIIVPIYNSEKTIERCVDSLLKQTYSNLQIILVNDGSKDDSLNICKRLATIDPRITIIDKENGGVSSARNEGLNNCSCDYVMFVDSDDALDVDYIENMFYNLSNCDLVISGINIIVGNKNRNMFFDKELDVTKVNFKILFEEKNGYGLFSSLCNKIYKTKLISKEIPYDISNGEDAIFNISYLKNCKKIRLTNKFKYNYYYCNPNSLTKKYKDSIFLDTIEVVKQLKTFSEQFQIDERFINRILMRTICSITKSLIKNKNFDKKQKMCIIKRMLQDENTIKASSNYITFGVVEKLAFKLIKNKRYELFYFCCKIK